MSNELRGLPVADKNDLMRRYLDNAVAARRGIEGQFRAFASDGDDDEVKAVFLACAEDAHLQAEQLAAGVEHPSAIKAAAAGALAAAPRAAQLGHIQEERTVQNLIAAYTLEAGACAMFQGLVTAAQAAGRADIAHIAHEAQQKCTSTAERLFHFIPTRSIIAYNMLTLTEIDPSVETKYREASWST